SRILPSCDISRITDLPLKSWQTYSRLGRDTSRYSQADPKQGRPLLAICLMSTHYVGDISTAPAYRDLLLSHKLNEPKYLLGLKFTPRNHAGFLRISNYQVNSSGRMSPLVHL